MPPAPGAALGVNGVEVGSEQSPPAGGMAGATTGGSGGSPRLDLTGKVSCSPAATRLWSGFRRGAKHPPPGRKRQGNPVLVFQRMGTTFRGACALNPPITTPLSFCHEKKKSLSGPCSALQRGRAGAQGAHLGLGHLRLRSPGTCCRRAGFNPAASSTQGLMWRWSSAR